MYGYTWLRPEARRTVIRTGAKIILLGAIVFGLRGVLLSPEQPERVQLLAYYAGVMPYTWAIGYISQVCAANQAKKWPTLEAACRKAKPVIISLVAFTLLICVLFPATAISSHHRFVSPYPWLDATYNLTHLFFLGLSAIVFGLEAFRERYTKSTFMRVQHTALFIGSVTFSVLSANHLFAVSATVVNHLAVSWWETHHLFLFTELLALVLGGLAYMVGLFLYDSNEHLRRIHSLTDMWIEYRATLEHEMFVRFGSLVGNRRSDTYFKLITDPAFHQDTFPFKLHLSDQERANAAYMFKLLGLISHADAEVTRQITGLKTLHKRLAKDDTAFSALIVRRDATTAYDLTHDSLYEATQPVLELTSKTAKTDLRNQPSWIQVAAVLAANAEFLPSHIAISLLHKNSTSISATVRDSYLAAKDPDVLDYVLNS